MLRKSCGATILVLVLLGLVHSQEKADDKKPDKPEGRLPAFYKKLAVTEEQQQQIFKIRAESKKKVDALKQEIERIRLKERADCEKVLTPRQLKHLQDLRSGLKSTPLETPKK